MNEDKIFELAEKLADEAYGDKGVYLYSERQDLTSRLNDILKSELKNLSKGDVIKSVCVCGDDYLRTKGMDGEYYCTRCGNKV